MNIQLRPDRASSVQADKSRVAKYDWVKISEDLSSQGCAVIERLLSPDECRQVATLYSQEEYFRSHVHMARHGFGKGEYRYFKYPLLSSLRTAIYPHLAVIANEWNARMNIDRRYPAQHVDFLKVADTETNVCLINGLRQAGISYNFRYIDHGRSIRLPCSLRWWPSNCFYKSSEDQVIAEAKRRWKILKRGRWSCPLPSFSP